MSEIGQTARSAINALNSTPVMLGILLFNIAFMATVAWSTHENGERWERVVAAAVKQCIPPMEQGK